MYQSTGLAMKEFLMQNWQWIATSIGIAIAWFRKEIGLTSSRKQSKAASDADVSTVNLQNLSRALELYKGMIDDLVPRYEDQLAAYRVELNRYRDQLEQYRVELKERDREIVILHKEISNLNIRLREIEKCN